MTTLKIYKTHPDVVLPKFGTQQAACFDIAFQTYTDELVYQGYNEFNAPFTRSTGDKRIVIMPGDRVLIPTGLIFDIPEGYSVRIHPRSGLSYKNGLILANLEAVIDSDYYHETFIILTNTTKNAQTIGNGDRIAQAELFPQAVYTLVETTEKPGQKSDRIGGLGSTGVNISAPVKVAPEKLIETLEKDAEKLLKNDDQTQTAVKRGRGRPRKTA